MENPKHIAIIMDGNGRWAKSRGLMRSQGHVAGVDRLEDIVAATGYRGIKYLTVFAFSTENWSRPEGEVNMLMKTILTALGQKTKRLHEQGVRINFIGRREGVSPDVLKAIDAAMQLTINNTLLTLNVAFNYGGRAEIVDAVNKFVKEAAEGKRLNVSEEDFQLALYTKDQPDVDFLIRTSGELRISNFLLWQLSYAELYFTPLTWPDFTASELEKALEDFSKRQRRWGGVD